MCYKTGQVYLLLTCVIPRRPEVEHELCVECREREAEHDQPGAFPDMLVQYPVEQPQREGPGHRMQDPRAEFAVPKERESGCGEQVHQRGEGVDQLGIQLYAVRAAP